MANAEERLKTLRNGLLKLHKDLLESEKAAYERDVQRITSTGQYLELVLHDPWFAWLHELSRFIVTIDETLDLEELPGGVDAKLVTMARAMVVPSETGNGFARSYYEAMQRDPGVVLAHGEMMKVFAQVGV
jgi:hypothetical protein